MLIIIIRGGPSSSALGSQSPSPCPFLIPPFFRSDEGKETKLIVFGLLPFSANQKTRGLFWGIGATR
jgi:hypothetical protein